MNNRFLSLLGLAIILAGTLTSCVSSVESGEPTELTDTKRRTIYSGRATLTFDGRPVTIDAAYLIDGVDVEIEEGTYSSASGSEDQVVFLVINGGSLKIAGAEQKPVTVTKSGSSASNGHVDDSYNFYGINSAIVVAGDRSKADIENADIITNSNGANAVVATAGGYVEIRNSNITTTGSAGSRGLHATYKGRIDAEHVSIRTQGGSSAALATDRGGGTVNASFMKLETNSAGSPLVYSTGTITVTDSTGCANEAQMVVVEGGSTANINRCSFTGSGDGNRRCSSEIEASDHMVDACGIFIYQSFSGDSEHGKSSFTATDSTFTLENGGRPMFYLTNITAEVTINDGCAFNLASSEDYLLVAEATGQGGWGRSGENGASVEVRSTDQNLSGKVFIGSSRSGSSLVVNGNRYSSSAALGESISL